jgi:hypothetical protein
VRVRSSFGPILLSVLLTAAAPALAFDDSLSSISIRDAYMLGNRKDFKTAEFFERYKHSFPMPESGPHVAVISVETPFGQIVELGEADMNTDIQGTVQRLAEKQFPFIVRVGVNMTDTYPCPPPWNPRGIGVPIPNFERDFDIQLVQKHKRISATSTQVYLLTSDAVANIYQISGAIIELKYDVAAIDSYDDATVMVHTPDGQCVETIFDLGHLQ